jgi:hypothetical protein
MQLERVPSWLRWVLVLPASVAAAVVSYIAVQFGYKILTVIWGTGNSGVPARFQTDPDDPFNYIVYQGLAGAAMSLAFVYCGNIIAPKAKHSVSAVLAVLISLFFGAELFFALPDIVIAHIAYACGGIAGGVIAWRTTSQDA